MDGANLVRVRLDALTSDNVTKIFDGVKPKVAFGVFEVEVGQYKALEDVFKMDEKNVKGRGKMMMSSR